MTITPKSRIPASFNLTAYLGRPYHPIKYNCWTHVRQILSDAGIADLPAVDIDAGLKLIAMRTLANHEIRKSFLELEKPEDFCVVEMGTGNYFDHVGLFLAGRVSHCQESSGVVNDELKQLYRQFNKIRFYKYASNPG